MFTIREATSDDCILINKLAKQVFPATYKEILSPDQLDYMMEWMYAPLNIRKQMEEEGHVYFIAYQEDEPCGYVSVQPQGDDVFHLQKYMSFPLFRVHTWEANYLTMQYNTSKRFIRLPV